MGGKNEMHQNSARWVIPLAVPYPGGDVLPPSPTPSLAGSTIYPCSPASDTVTVKNAITILRYATTTTRQVVGSALLQYSLDERPASYRARNHITIISSSENSSQAQQIAASEQATTREARFGASTTKCIDIHTYAISSYHNSQLYY